MVVTFFEWLFSISTNRLLYSYFLFLTDWYLLLFVSYYKLIQLGCKFLFAKTDWYFYTGKHLFSSLIFMIEYLRIVIATDWQLFCSNYWCDLIALFLLLLWFFVNKVICCGGAIVLFILGVCYYKLPFNSIECQWNFNWFIKDKQLYGDIKPLFITSTP